MKEGRTAEDFADGAGKRYPRAGELSATSTASTSGGCAQTPDIFGSRSFGATAEFAPLAAWILSSFTAASN